MKKLSYLFRIAVALLVVFTIGRFVFVWYNSELGAHGFGATMRAWLQGFPMDVATIAYSLALPAVVTLAACQWNNLPVRKILMPYFIFLGALVGLVTVFNIVMYSHWQFNLGAEVVSYAMSPEGATNSVSFWYIALSVGSAVLLSIAVAVYSIRQVPRRLRDYEWEVKSSAIILLVTLICTVGYRAGYSFSESQPIFVNNAATNPVYNFVSTVHLRPGYAHRFRYMSQEDSEALVAELYAKEADEQLTDTLLRTDRPDILVVLMESFGGMFVKELGGDSTTAPNLSRLIPEGIWWENYYSNSFRTDRGTVSLYSGMVSHPDVCLMKKSGFHDALPSLPRDLAEQAGYRTVSLMAQPMTNMGKGRYLRNIGFQELYDHTAFADNELQASWGGHDGVSSQRAVRMVAENDSAHLFLAYQTVSSHEPWNVPYDRLEDKILNAFAYTDQCIGDMVDSLRTLPQWDNLLVIILPDHGYLYNVNFQTPEFFHSPMLWLGGAISKPRVMKALMSQNDVAATLLAQLGLSHQHYRWSRNVLGTGYRHPFVYSNYPAGMMMLDSTGVSIFDLHARKYILDHPDDGKQRLHRAKAILQASYRELDDF